MSYADVTRKLKKIVDTEALGVKVSTIKHIRNGAISIVVGKGEEAAMTAEKLKVTVEAILGSEAGVRLHTSLLQFEVCGISIGNTSDDIQKSVLREGVSLSYLRVKLVRPARNGTLTGLIKIPEHTALRLLKKERFRVGSTYCKLRFHPIRL